MALFIQLILILVTKKALKDLMYKSKYLPEGN